MADDHDGKDEEKVPAQPTGANLIVFPGGRGQTDSGKPSRPADRSAPQPEGFGALEVLLSAGKPPEKDVDRLRRLADENLGVCRSEGRAYVFMKEQSQAEAWPAHSSRTADVLHDLFDQDTGRLLAPATINAVWRHLKRKASQAGPGAVGRRWCAHGGNIYLDLRDPDGRYVEIDECGWRLTSGPPVRFEKLANMAPLPVPVSGGSIELLQHYVNVPDADDFHLVVSFVIGCMVPGLPFPVLQITGGHGTAKTETACFIMRLVDPQVEDPGGLPTNETNLFIAAAQDYLPVFDNVSFLSPQHSDAICRVTTGGSHRGRKYTTNGEQHIIPAHAPVIITAIDSVIGRPDLSSRAITIRLPPIEKHRPLAQLLNAFERDRPKILGALLDMLSHALRNRATTTVESDHRLADFAVIASAAETYYRESGSFARALEANRLSQNDDLLDHDPVIDMVVRFVQAKGSFKGTATELLETLIEVFREEIGSRRTLPGAPHHLSRQLNSKESLLSFNGIVMEQSREGPRGTRIIALRSVPPRASRAAV